MREGRGGFTAVELIVALLLAGVIAAAAVGLYGGALAATRAATGDAAADGASRTASLLLAQELRFESPRADPITIAPDSIALRAYRAAAIVCASADDTVRVLFSGARDPDAAKDSLLWVRADGTERGAALFAAQPRPGGCPGAGWGEGYLLRLTSPAPPVGALLLLFERGSYHLAASALRYRRGAGGRQPLTDLRIADGESAFAPVLLGGALEAVGIRVVALDPARPGLRRPLAFRVTLLNGAR